VLNQDPLGSLPPAGCKERGINRKSGKRQKKREGAKFTDLPPPMSG